MPTNRKAPPGAPTRVTRSQTRHERFPGPVPEPPAEATPDTRNAANTSAPVSSVNAEAPSSDNVNTANPAPVPESASSPAPVPATPTLDVPASGSVPADPVVAPPPVASDPVPAPASRSRGRGRATGTPQSAARSRAARGSAPTRPCRARATRGARGSRGAASSTRSTPATIAVATTTAPADTSQDIHPQDLEMTSRVRPSPVEPTVISPAARSAAYSAAHAPAARPIAPASATVSAPVPTQTSGSKRKRRQSPPPPPPPPPSSPPALVSVQGFEGRVTSYSREDVGSYSASKQRKLPVKKRGLEDAGKKAGESSAAATTAEQRQGNKRSRREGGDLANAEQGPVSSSRPDPAHGSVNAAGDPRTDEAAESLLDLSRPAHGDRQDPPERRHEYGRVYEHQYALESRPDTNPDMTIKMIGIRILCFILKAIQGLLRSTTRILPSLESRIILTAKNGAMIIAGDRGVAHIMNILDSMMNIVGLVMSTVGPVMSIGSLTKSTRGTTTSIRGPGLRTRGLKMSISGPTMSISSPTMSIRDLMTSVSGHLADIRNYMTSAGRLTKISNIAMGSSQRIVSTSSQRTVSISRLMTSSSQLTYYSRPTSHRDQASSSSGAGSSGRLPRSQLVQNVHPLSNPGQSLEYYSISQRRQSNPNDPQTATSRQVYSSNSQPEPSSGNQQHYEEEEAVVARQAAAEPTSGLVQQDEALDEVRSSASTVSLI
ncbi:hypothetical protein BGX31_005332 [Mortierella sp. GBA43]|nr:hypothetical protein BGX31_005332 [Mortierella sp. GBA43]